MKIGELEAQLTLDDSAFNKRLKGIEKKIGQMNKTWADGIAVSMNQSLEIMAKFKSGLESSARSLIQTASSFEKLEKSLKSITGSAAQAKSDMKWIQAYAAQTPYALEDVAGAFKKMTSYG